MAIYAVKPGFDTKNILTMRMSLSGKAYRPVRLLKLVRKRSGANTSDARRGNCNGYVLRTT